MDPEAAVEMINSETLSREDRLEALEGLAEWIQGGGFHPRTNISDAAIEDLGGLAESVAYEIGGL